MAPRKWRLRTSGGTLASMVCPQDQPDTVRVVIAKAGDSVSYDVQLNLLNLKLESKHSYTLHFRARADHPRSVGVGAAQAHDPWMGLGLYEEIELSPEWRDFQKEFIATADDDYARIHFDLGTRAIPVEVSQVRLCRDKDDDIAGQNAQAPPNLDFGAFRRLTPISRKWGFDRGLPIDRYYIEEFLARHASDIRGRVLEIEDDLYTRNFGGDAVAVRDVLHVAAGNPRATIVADLTDAGHIPSDLFDCAIVTETLQYIYEVRAAVTTLHRILKPGGVLLATFPGLTRISQEEWADSWFWRFTAASARRLFGDVFGDANVEIQSAGNVLSAVSFLHGLAKEDLRQEELDHRDPDYEVIITVRAVKLARTS
jgi:SAM-dependent methyltransferase